MNENVQRDTNQLENRTLEDTASDIQHGRGNDTPMKTINGMFIFTPIQQRCTREMPPFGVLANLGKGSVTKKGRKKIKCERHRIAEDGGREGSN
jgi:hypothetical protein